MYDEWVNQNDIPIKMTATKVDLNTLEANFDRKIEKNIKCTFGAVVGDNC